MVYAPDLSPGIRGFNSRPWLSVLLENCFIYLQKNIIINCITFFITFILLTKTIIDMIVYMVSPYQSMGKIDGSQPSEPSSSLGQGILFYLFRQLIFTNIICLFNNYCKVLIVNKMLFVKLQFGFYFYHKNFYFRREFPNREKIKNEILKNKKDHRKNPRNTNH